MKISNVIVLLIAAMNLAGCSIDYINSKLKPVNDWYEGEYEKTRFTQRYKFTKSDIDVVRKEVVNTAPQVGMTVTSTDNVIVASGNPTTMFTTAECEAWAKEDLENTKEKSGGLLTLTCDSSNKTSIIIANISTKKFKKGTLIVLDYELKNAEMEAYGVISPKRPPPAASKAGSSKFWNLLSIALPHPITDVTKEDLK